MYYFFFQQKYKQKYKQKYNSPPAIFDKDWSNDPQLIKMLLENDVITTNKRNRRCVFVAMTVR